MKYIYFFTVTSMMALALQASKPSRLQQIKEKGREALNKFTFGETPALRKRKSPPSVKPKKPSFFQRTKERLQAGKENIHRGIQRTQRDIKKLSDSFHKAGTKAETYDSPSTSGSKSSFSVLSSEQSSSKTPGEWRTAQRKRQKTISLDPAIGSLPTDRHILYQGGGQ